jgi:hypothetical protein
MPNIEITRYAAVTEATPDGDITVATKEISGWNGVPEGHPLGVELEGWKGRFVLESVAECLADMGSLAKVPGRGIEPGTKIALFELPLREGVELIDQAAYERLLRETTPPEHPQMGALPGAVEAIAKVSS